MKNQDGSHLENVKMKHSISFRGREKTRVCWGGEAGLSDLNKEFSCTPFPTEVRRRSCSAQHPAVHQCSGIPQQQGGCTEPTSPALAWAQNFLSNKDDSLVTAAAA